MEGIYYTVSLITHHINVKTKPPGDPAVFIFLKKHTAFIVGTIKHSIDIFIYFVIGLVFI